MDVVALQFKDTNFHKLTYEFSAISITISPEYFGRTGKTASKINNKDP